jgi:mono/diheme cytochrome c family protein
VTGWRAGLIGWVAGGATALVVAAAGGLVVVYSGIFDAAATTPHLPFIAWATHTTMKNSVRWRAEPIRAPAAFTQAQVIAGLRDYDQNCAACHGGPGVSRARWASAMTPTPSYLLDAARRWTAPQLDWIVAHGVKMTAMPGWSEVRSNAQVWDLVAFLEALPSLSPSDYARLRAANTAGGDVLQPPPSPPRPAGVQPR